MDANTQIIQLAQQLLYTPNLLQAELKNIYDVSLSSFSGDMPLWSLVWR